MVSAPGFPEGAPVVPDDDRFLLIEEAQQTYHILDQVGELVLVATPLTRTICGFSHP